jgi:hypothetical protein
MLVPDLILAIIELLVDDIRALCTCSLVSKSWLQLARRQLFDDLTIELCVQPNRHNLCHHCIGHFAPLLASPYCTVPRAIRTLRLSGNHVEKNWINVWSLVGNPHGMRRPQFIWALAQYFWAVDRLEMIRVDWFNPPWTSSRTVSRFLSSIKWLTLCGVLFYGSPRGLFWMLDRMPCLEVLVMKRLWWRPLRDMPNNSPALLVLTTNASHSLLLVFSSAKC